MAIRVKVITALLGVFLIMTSWDSLEIDNMTTRVEILKGTARKLPFLTPGASVSLQISYSDSQDTSLQRYDGLDPKIINNTCHTEENGTTTYI